MNERFETHGFFGPNKLKMEQNEILTLKMREYYKRSINSVKDPDKFSEFIIQKLNNLKSPLRILTNSVNIADGIGDYNNQLDFNIWLEELFSGFDNIILSSITFFEAPRNNELPKETLAAKITPERLHSKLLLIESGSQFKAISFDSQKMFYVPQTVYKNIIKPSELPSNLEKIDFFLNMATPIFSNRPSYQLYEQLSRGCLIQSRTEYGIYHSASLSSDDKICREIPMGVRSYETGIKFYPSLQKSCKENNTLEKKIELFDGVENKAIQKAIGGMDKSEFIRSHGFAFGYLQSKSYSIEFVLMMSAIFRNDNKEGIFIINLDHFNEVVKENFFQVLLKSHGISQIKMIDSQANVESILLDEENKGKRLTLINFRGMSNEDKNKMITLSYAVGGSGNTSFSEMISSEKLPFIQCIHWVTNFYKSFVKQLSEYNVFEPELTEDLLKGRYVELEDGRLGVKKNISKLSENDKLLYQYLILQMKLVNDNNKVHKILGPELKGKDHIEILMDFVSREGNLAKIMEAWGRYCSFLEEKRNTYNDLIDMVVTAIVMKEFELASEEELEELLSWFPSGTVGGISFFHIAIVKQLDIDKKIHLLDLLGNLNVPLTSSMGREQWVKQYTPLMLTALYGEKELFEHILQSERLITKNETTSSIQEAYIILSEEDNQDFLAVLFNCNNEKIMLALATHEPPSYINRII